MTKQIIKTVLAGILAGAALFLAPFILIRVLLFVLLIGAVARLLGRRHRFGGRMHPAFAEKIRNMSEEEWTKYRQSYSSHCGRYRQPATETK